MLFFCDDIRDVCVFHMILQLMRQLEERQLSPEEQKLLISYLRTLIKQQKEQQEDRNRERRTESRNHVHGQKEDASGESDHSGRPEMMKWNVFIER